MGENGREKKKAEEERGRVRKGVGEKERKKERAISCSWNPNLVKFLETVGREKERIGRRERKSKEKRGRGRKRGRKGLFLVSGVRTR